MIYRLLIVLGAGLLLVSEPALADFSITITNPHGNPPTAAANDDRAYYDGVSDDEAIAGDEGYAPAYGPNGVDPYGYSPYFGPYGDDAGYPILPAPLLGPAPTVVPPLIARPVMPQPRILVHLRGGGWIAIPDPRIHRIVTPYPDFQTSGSAYYPTPTYPLTIPEARRLRHFNRHPRHDDR